MIPISDDNPARLRPYVTWSLIGLCVVVFLWQLTQPEDAVVGALGFVPVTLFQATRAFPWAWITIFTAMFLHGGFLHLGGNMLYLWIFGNNVEDAMGHTRFIVFYLACGVAAALFQALTDTTSTVPMLGASGAISGVLSSYVMIFPRARVNVIIPLVILFYPLKISAIYVVGFWFLLQLSNLAFTAPGAAGTAWWAHVGGFLMGAALTPLFSQFPLFGRHPLGPWH
jgi:membrane associated rhomboid family serine protease